MKDLKDSMVENIESLIQRDGKIEIMAETAQQLSTVSNSYRKRAAQVKNQERRKKYTLCFVTAFVIAAIVAVVLWMIFSKSGDDSKAFALVPESR